MYFDILLGIGIIVELVWYCFFFFCYVLFFNYVVIFIIEFVFFKEFWFVICVLFVIFGGGDLGYCCVFNGEGNCKILDFICRGGVYLGLCVGGYYGSRKCEFEVGNLLLEVIGSRELGFFFGICCGVVYKGFEYYGEGGVRVVRFNVV